MKQLHSKLSLALLAAVVGMSPLISNCGQKPEVNVDQPGGVLVMSDDRLDAARGKVGDSGVTMNRVRIWKRNPASEFASSTSGEAPDFDLLTAELWFNIEGESQERYRKITGLRADSNGWLFPSESLGGIPSHRNNTTPYDQFQRRAEEGFVIDDVPAILEYDRGTNIVLDASKPVVQPEVVEKVRMKMLDAESGITFGGIRGLQYAAESALIKEPRVTWIKNEATADGLTLKGKMACLIETRNGGSNGNGSFNNPQLIEREVELGDFIHNESGGVQAGPAVGLTTCDSPRCGTYDGSDATADDAVWIKVQERFNIIGMNIQPGKKQIIVAKDQFMPFYMNRELPSPQRSGKAKMSGIEELIRSCNDIAIQNSIAVASNKILGLTDSATAAPFGILPTIGFRLVAPASGESGGSGRLFATDLITACEALPDTKSPSAGLNLPYASIRKNEGASAATGASSCSGAVPGGPGVAARLGGKSMGAVLDLYISAGTWDGQSGRHSGLRLEGGRGASDKPMHRVQKIGTAKLDH